MTWLPGDHAHGADGVTRRQALALAGVPVLAGLGAYAATELAGVGGGRGFRPAGPGTAREELQRAHLPNVPLVTQHRERVRFYDDLVRDRKVVLTFVATGVEPSSSTVAQTLAKLQRFFGARVGRELWLYSITRTPEVDTPDVLRAFARRHAAGPGWTFLTGEPGDVELLRRSLGFASSDPAEDADPVFAIGQLRHGDEPAMRWAHCQALASPRVIAHSLLLDFGSGQVESGAVPPWNCSLALANLA
jgi:protein SCO1/2